MFALMLYICNEATICHSIIMHYRQDKPTQCTSSHCALASRHNNVCLRQQVTSLGGLLIAERLFIKYCRRLQPKNKI